MSHFKIWSVPENKWSTSGRCFEPTREKCQHTSSNNLAPPYQTPGELCDATLSGTHRGLPRLFGECQHLHLMWYLGPMFAQSVHS